MTAEWLGLRASTVVGQFQAQAADLRSHKPRGAAKTQAKSKRTGSFTSCGRKQPPCCEEAQAASRAAQAGEHGGPGPTAPSTGHLGRDADRQHVGSDR